MGDNRSIDSWLDSMPSLDNVGGRARKTAVPRHDKPPNPTARTMSEHSDDHGPEELSSGHHPRSGVAQPRGGRIGGSECGHSIKSHHHHHHGVGCSCPSDHDGHSHIHHGHESCHRPALAHCGNSTLCQQYHGNGHRCPCQPSSAHHGPCVRINERCHSPAVPMHSVRAALEVSAADNGSCSQHHFSAKPPKHVIDGCKDGRPQKSSPAKPKSQTGIANRGGKARQTKPNQGYKAGSSPESSSGSEPAETKSGITNIYYNLIMGNTVNKVTHPTIDKSQHTHTTHINITKHGPTQTNNNQNNFYSSNAHLRGQGHPERSAHARLPVPHAPQHPGNVKGVLAQRDPVTGITVLSHDGGETHPKLNGSKLLTYPRAEEGWFASPRTNGGNHGTKVHV